MYENKCALGVSNAYCLLIGRKKEGWIGAAVFFIAGNNIKQLLLLVYLGNFVLNGSWHVDLEKGH